jgi:hypothetical protein
MAEAAPNPMVQSMFGIMPVVTGLVGGKLAFERLFTGPYTRSMIMGVYLGGLISGMVLRYRTSDGTSVCCLRYCF